MRTRPCSMWPAVSAPAKRSAILWAAVIAIIGSGSTGCFAQLCAQLSGVNFSENFNTLGTTGSNNSAVPSEFAYNESPGNLVYSADNGSSSSGDTYSYGSTGSSDRALGELTSSTVRSRIGACFVNNTNHPITSFLIGYTGEQWRLAANGGTGDRLDFQFSPDATSLSTGTYIDVNELDFTSPNTSTAGALNGNSASNRHIFAPFAITPASPIQPEKTFYIRWEPLLVAGTNTNDGLAIDDFTIGVALAPGTAGDYNNNGQVDAADYVVWRERRNQATTIPNDITPGTVVDQDYTEWRNRFGNLNSQLAAGTAVPEPAGACLLAVLLVFAFSWQRCRLG